MGEIRDRIENGDIFIDISEFKFRINQESFTIQDNYGREYEVVSLRELEKMIREIEDDNEYLEEEFEDELREVLV